MANISVDQFLAAVYDWMSTHVEAIEANWPQAGGWEAWAQSEIVRYLGHIHPLVIAQREHNVFADPAQRADFLINAPEHFAENIVVEMKCQSLSNAQNFVNGLANDVYKLDHGLDASYSVSRKLVIGFFFTDHFKLPPGWVQRIEPTNRIGLCHIVLRS